MFEMTYNVLMGTLNPIHSLTPSIAELLPLCHLQNFGLCYLECAMFQNLPMLYVRKLYRYTAHNVTVSQEKI